MAFHLTKATVVPDEQMRLILCLILTTWGVCAKSNSNVKNDSGEELLREYAERYSSERQFLSTMRKWLFGRGDDKKTVKTEVKYLPIYVPVPVYSSMKVPSGSEFYGAHQHNREEKGEEIMFTPQVPSKPGLPYPHVENYGLPYGNNLYPMLNSFPAYYNPYGEQRWKAQYMAYLDSTPMIVNSGNNEAQWLNGNDSEVIDNPEILKEPTEETTIVKRRKNKKKRS